MAKIEQIVATVDILNVNVVIVRPAGGPGLRDLKVIAAVSEMRPAFDHVYVADGEVVVASEVRLVMFVCNSATFFMMFLLSSVLVLSFLVVILLGKSGHSPTQKERSTDTADYCQSFHGNLA